MMIRLHLSSTTLIQGSRDRAGWMLPSSRDGCREYIFCSSPALLQLPGCVHKKLEVKKLDIRKHFSFRRVLVHQNRLPMEVVE